MKGIKSKNHNIGTYEDNKISISCFDDKRFILENGINTLAYGHKDIQKWEGDKINKISIFDTESEHEYFFSLI